MSASVQSREIDIRFSYNMSPSKKYKSRLVGWGWSAPGWDELTSKILKEIIHILGPILVIFIKKYFSGGIFADSLKTTVVMPVYKAGNTDEFTDYQPTSLLSCYSKILVKPLRHV